MNKTTIGISDISVYLPQNRILVEKILSKRSEDDPAFHTRLSRAIASTDQYAIRFPSQWEDSAVLAANATLRLLEQKPDPGEVRYLVVGSETTVDLSKSMSAYVQGMIAKSPTPLPTKLSSFQVQHACAGATLGMLSVAALIQAAGRPGESGIVVASDIARYDAPSTAEITQGSGAAAMLIEKNPKLLSFDLDSQGFSSSDVDDFFRPLGSTTAKVKGRYSVQCYNDALDEAFLDFCTRKGLTATEALEQTDYFVFHVPFAKMANTAVRRLLSNHLNIFGTEAEEFLAPRGFFSALDVTAYIGNMYTGAIYLNLMATLYQEYQKIGKDIVGKKILFSSYGSGNTMVVFDGVVMEDAPRIIEGWDPDDFLNHYQEVEFPEYEQWLNRVYDTANYNPETAGEPEAALAGRFYLHSIREDGYRDYRIKG